MIHALKNIAHEKPCLEKPKKNIAHICLCVCFPCMYICAICFAVSLEGLELQMVISCHVGAGDPGPLEEQPVFLAFKPSLLASTF